MLQLPKEEFVCSLQGSFSRSSPGTWTYWSMMQIPSICLTLTVLCSLPVSCFFAIWRSLLSVLMIESGLGCWVHRLLRKVVGAHERWPTGSWQRPKRWPARSPRLRDLIPGKHHIHVSLAVCIRSMSVRVVSKPRVGGSDARQAPQCGLCCSLCQNCPQTYMSGCRVRGLTSAGTTFLFALQSVLHSSASVCVRTTTEVPELGQEPPPSLPEISPQCGNAFVLSPDVAKFRFLV